MEVETGVALRGAEYSLESELQVQEICRVRTNSGERSVEVHCDTLHTRKRVGDEVAHVLRRRHTTVDNRYRKRSDQATDVRDCRLESAVDVKRHGAGPVDRPTLAVCSAGEVSGVTNECRIAEAERGSSYNYGVVEELAVRRHRILNLWHEHSRVAGIAVIADDLQRIRAVGILAHRLFKEEVRFLLNQVFPAQRTVVLVERLGLTLRRRCRIGKNHVAATEAGTGACRTDELRSIGEVILRALRHEEAGRASL